MNFFGTVLALIILLLAPGIAAAQALIQSINPAQGPITGGTQVTLTGSGFTGATLTLDGTTITPTSASNTQIVFQTPVRENGIASVQLSGNGPIAYAEFLYLPPSLQSLPPGYITTVMGMGLFRGDGRQATNAMVDPGAALGFAMSGDGSLFFSEPNNNVIRRVRPDGILERYAGTGTGGYSGDGGPALKAQLIPRGLAFDSKGNLLVADALETNCIRRIDAATGIISTLYGGKTAGFSGDGGPAANAQFNNPLRVTFDGLGNLYVLEFGNVRIRKIDTRGIITTIAGTGATGFSGDGGPATQATFNLGMNDWGGLAADSTGNVYLADSSNGRVRKIDSATGIITTVVADAGRVTAVITDHDDNLYVGMNNMMDKTAPRILKLSPSGQLLQSWGKGIGYSDDGVEVANAPLCVIPRLVLDHSGNIIFADECTNRLRRINITTGRLETIAGTGTHIIGETGPALATVLPLFFIDLLFRPSGDLLATAYSDFRVRRMDPQGNVSNFAGNGYMVGMNGEGNTGVPALEAYVSPFGLALTPGGDTLMLSPAGLSRIDNAGIIHAVNYLDQYGFSGDGGAAINAITYQPHDVATDASGNIFIADTNNNRIRRIDAQTGIINTVAGSGPSNGWERYGSGSSCGDGGPATQACINTPYGIAVAPDGTMYIGENGERIRKVTPDGTISTFFSDGGSRVRLSSTGNLFMGSFRIQPNGHAFKVVFESPTQSAIGDGIVARSQQSGYRRGAQGMGIAIDSEGNLFIADPQNGRIRAIRYGAVMAEPGSTVAASGGSAQMAATGAAFPTALQITLKSPEGTRENGIRVDFAAPASGASCTFAGGSSTYSALTDIDGHASATCTANAQTGAYSVTATPLALGQSASFALTNSNSVTTPPTCTLTASPVVISAGSSSTLSASCTPDATSYVWTNSGFGSGVSSGAVSPATPTIYTVVASNAAGSSNAASAAVYVCNTAPSQIYAGQTLVGTGASEPFHSGIGNDTIDGGAGINTVIYNCNRSSFTLTKTASGWTLSSAAEGIDTLTNIDRIQFPNETLALDISGNAGQAYRIYQAAFNRTPDNAGLKYWIGVMDNGASLHDVAAGFINSAEFQSLYGTNPTNPEFVTKLYSNVLHRAPDQAGYDYWVDVLNRHLISNIDTLVNFSESPENYAGVLGAILNGIDLLN